jgi:hypothetical protein
MNFEITMEHGTTRTREIVNDAGVDEFGWANQWPYSNHIALSEHLIGWTEMGSFDTVAWNAKDGAEFTARVLYPGETPSLSIAPTRTWGNLRAF